MIAEFLPRPAGNSGDDDEPDQSEARRAPFLRSIEPEESATAPTTGRGTIVVVNDNTHYLELMRILLEGANYRVTTSMAPKDAYPIIKKVLPDLVIIDLVFANDSGLNLIQVMKLDDSTASIPIIVTSGATLYLKETTEHLRELGCAVLAKPFRSADLLGVVEQSCGAVPE